MRAIVLVLAAVVGLAGCEKPVEEMGYAERQQLAAQIVERCKALGIAPGSAQMNACTEAEVNKEVYTRRANKIRRQELGTAMQQASQNYQQSIAMQQSRQINCTHRPAVGWGSATTTCY
ncbi:hypothetical protein [Paracoccus sp. (in: a-proteobacteria)]|uniref:hypothetical protein n=1 Tax=Paracoccus sp. TaxID=267 RepID=UPI00333F4FF0